jgi:hypothetical protein
VPFITAVFPSITNIGRKSAPHAPQPSDSRTIR